jgi:hypothetical protein
MTDPRELQAGDDVHIEALDRLRGVPLRVSDVEEVDMGLTTVVAVTLVSGSDGVPNQSIKSSPDANTSEIGPVGEGVGSGADSQAATRETRGEDWADTIFDQQIVVE